MQKCHIDFGSTAYSNNKLILQTYKSTVHTELHQETEFDLLKAKYMYLDFDETDLGSKYSNKHTKTIIRTQLLMRRKVVFYMNKIISKNN